MKGRPVARERAAMEEVAGEEVEAAERGQRMTRSKRYEAVGRSNRAAVAGQAGGQTRRGASGSHNGKERCDLAAGKLQGDITIKWKVERTWQLD
jgi:hypothetical protein